MGKNEFKIIEWEINKLKKRKLWIPYMNDSAYILSSVLKSKGYDAEILPNSDDPLFSLGREHTNNDQCLPSIITTEEILQRVFSSDFEDNKEAFFQGKSEGPCRFGRYYMNQLLILHDLGKGNTPIFTLDNKDAYSGLGSEFKILVWDGIVGQAMLERSLHFTRPFEVKKGESELTYNRYLKEICSLLEKNKKSKGLNIIRNQHKRDLTDLLISAVCDFKKIKKKQEEKPIIYLTGEIYVRNSSKANQDLITNIENLGGVVLLEPAFSFFNCIIENKFREIKENFYLGKNQGIQLFKSFLDLKITNRDEHDLTEIFRSLLGDYCFEPPTKLVFKHGSKYLHKKIRSEAILSLGGADYFSEKVDGVINTFPFNCMPGLIVSSKTNEFRKQNNNIPFLNLSYDGYLDANRDTQLGIFMYQIKESIKRG